MLSVNSKSLMLASGLPLLLACLLTGCGVPKIAHSDPYEVGVAKVGDRTFMYAPLCDTDRLQGVRIDAFRDPLDNRRKEALWDVGGGGDEVASLGLFEVGSVSGFRVTNSRLTQPLPGKLDVTVHLLRSGSTELETGAIVWRANAPNNPESRDLRQLQFRLGDKVRTIKEMRDWVNPRCKKSGKPAPAPTALPHQ
jgi:hypothetical protein